MTAFVLEVAARHVPYAKQRTYLGGKVCAGCSKPWPCDAARLAELLQPTRLV